jgi:putative beta-lysine N-acetyltransferase
MADKIETIQGSVIQHGRHNDRIYLMHLHGANPHALIAALDEMAAEHAYGKIFAKIPSTAWHHFQKAGYIQEACVPGFFNGKTDGLFIAKFFSKDRQQPNRETAIGGKGLSPEPAQTANPPVSIHACRPIDAAAMANIYRRTFITYAFPIHRPDYIRQTMAQNTVYFSVRIDNHIAGLAAAEIDAGNQVCEMTDFATLHEYRRMGLAFHLLRRLDREAVARNVKTAYTIARADSTGMNRVFEKCGYAYAGQLVNNTQIGGRIRGMNVWYKNLSEN